MAGGCREGGEDEGDRGGEGKEGGGIRGELDKDYMDKKTLHDTILCEVLIILVYLPKSQHKMKERFLSGLLGNPGTSYRQSSL